MSLYFFIYGGCLITYIIAAAIYCSVLTQNLIHGVEVSAQS